MTPSISKKFASLVAVFVLVVLLRTATLAETAKVEGVIVGRSGSEIIVEYLQGTELAFLLDDSTKVSQTGGMFKARRTDKSMAALIPGLKVKVEGEYNQDRKLVATSVKFSGGDLEKAQLSEEATRQHRKQTEEHKADLEKQAAALKAQNEQLQVHQEPELIVPRARQFPRSSHRRTVISSWIETNSTRPSQPMSRTTLQRSWPTRRCPGASRLWAEPSPSPRGGRSRAGTSSRPRTG